MTATRRSSLLLPPAFTILLPVAHAEAVRLGLLPLRARLGHGGFIASVEHIDDARIGRGVVELRAVDQEADLRSIRVVATRGKVNGMGLHMTVACRAMGKKALLAIGQQQRVERLDALLACGLHGGAPAAFQRALEKV